MTSQQNSIPNYNLYGEIGDLPDVAHCEAISIRAARHDWHIKPHRHARLHQFFCVYSGGAQCHIDGQEIQLSGPQVLSIPPRVVHGFVFSAGTQGWVVTVPIEVLNQQIVQNLFPQLNRTCQITPDNGLITLFDELAIEHSSRRYGRAHVLQSLTMLIAGLIIRTFNESGQNDERLPGSPLFQQFEELLEQHYCDHWTLAKYASKLGATPTHLTRLANQYASISGSKFIEARLMREARRDLAYTSLTISEIAYRIGYVDPAYFARVFSRATGMTPTAFRKRLEQ